MIPGFHPPSYSQAWIANVSEVNPTFVNKQEISTKVPLAHLDVFTINDRSFRFEYLGKGNVRIVVDDCGV